MKIAINRCYGGFSVSKAVTDELGFEYNGGYLSNKNFGIESFDCDKYRADPRLISAIEKVGCEKASGECSKIKIEEIPDGVFYNIREYDGRERIEYQ